MTRSTARRPRRAAPHTPLALAACTLVLVACGSAPTQPTGGGELGAALGGADGRIPKPLEPYVLADRAEGGRNLVLNAMLAGKAAMDIGAVAQARRALDRAYQQIETIYADNPAAAKARSTFVPESNKDFKGEPYERVMVGYYVGLADLLLGDLDNARASFKWGEFQDTMSAAEQYQGDTASLRWLTGWVHHCKGTDSSAREAFKLAAEVRPAMKPPGADDNVLVIVEAGAAPRKQRAGRHGELLTYAPRAGLHGDTSAEIEYADSKLSAVLAEDIHWQATTLGGRQVDNINAGKAAFKDNATTVANVGSGMATVGLEVARISAITGDQRSLNLGLAGSALGLLGSIAGSIAAASAQAEADIRQWSNLPGAVFIGSARVDAAQAGSLRFTARAPAALGGAAASGTALPIPGTRCHVVRLATGGGGGWNATDQQQWVATDEVARKPLAPKAPSRSDPDGPKPEPVKTAPVRATF